MLSKPVSTIRIIRSSEGLLVAWTGSNYPDLIIGGVVGGFVVIGAKRILALKG